MAIFLYRNVGREYNFVCPSKPVGEKQWVPGRVLCYFTAYTNSSRCCKVATGVCPISPVVGRRSRWRSFASSLNLENGPAPSSSTSSSSGQTSEQPTSAEVLVKLGIISFSHVKLIILRTCTTYSWNQLFFCVYKGTASWHTLSKWNGARIVLVPLEMVIHITVNITSEKGKANMLAYVGA